jgi:predicted Zn-dependent peptidase
MRPAKIHPNTRTPEHLNTLLPVLLLTALTLGANAQDTGGVSQTGTGSVSKGKAPVAKELLKVRFPRPKSFKLENGVTVYVLEDHRLPAVRFRLLMHAGTLYEPKSGVAEATASMLTEGTQTKTFQQLAEATENIGASLNASAALDTATISAGGLSESTDTLIALLADVLLHPTFPSDRLDRIKFQQTSQIGQRRTNPTALTAELSGRVFYGGTPYAASSPKAAQLAAITQDDLTAFHAAYYRPNGALLGVSGDVDMRTLKGKLEAAFADWKPGPKTAELPPAEVKPKEATKVYLVDRPGSAQTVLLFGNLAVRYKDADYIPLVVANRILGGGSSGRLFQNIREQKGYTYGAYSTLGASQWPGLWTASASVRTAVTEPATREFFYEFNRLQDQPVPEAEMERAKRSLVGSFAGTLENPEGILERALVLVQNGLPADYWDTYPARIQAVTAADVQRVARQYLGKNRIQVIAVGERSQIEAGLKNFGPIEIVDAAELGGGGGGRGRRGR